MIFNNLTKKELVEVINTMFHKAMKLEIYHEVDKRYNQLVKENGYEQQYIRATAKKEELVIRAESLYTVLTIVVNEMANQ